MLHNHVVSVGLAQMANLLFYAHKTPPRPWKYVHRLLLHTTECAKILSQAIITYNRMCHHIKEHVKKYRNCPFWWKPYNASVRTLHLAQGTFYKFLATLHQCAPDDGWHFTITCQCSSDAKLFWCCYLIFFTTWWKKQSKPLKMSALYYSTREMKK